MTVFEKFSKFMDNHFMGHDFTFKVFVKKYYRKEFHWATSRLIVEVVAELHCNRCGEVFVANKAYLSLNQYKAMLEHDGIDKYYQTGDFSHIRDFQFMLEEKEEEDAAEL